MSHLIVKYRIHKLRKFFFVDDDYTDYAMKTVSNTMMILFLLLLGSLYNLALWLKLVFLEIDKFKGLPLWPNNNIHLTLITVSKIIFLWVSVLLCNRFDEFVA